MRKLKEFDKESAWVSFRVDVELKKKWARYCEDRGESEAEVGRKLIEKVVAQHDLEGGVDELVTILRPLMKDILQPHTERLAAINAKTAIAAGTSMYMNTQVISNMGQDAKSIYENARKKAVEFVREKQNS